ncbi:MAG TPA: response regulator, partial [Planctomycetota bacterium]|nr:response regulator [Planctomycetota bacterium]
GLGLTIVRHLVERHGGTVHAESAGADRGATFVVDLPAAPEAATAAAGRAERSAQGRALELAGRSVLIVEDEPDTAEVVSLLLEQAGARTTVVASVRAALESLRFARPDVIVSDVGLPDADGLSLIRELRAGVAGEDRRGIPALAVTAYAREQDRRAALDAGFDAFLAKPIDGHEFTRVVGALSER